MALTRFMTPFAIRCYLVRVHVPKHVRVPGAVSRYATALWIARRHGSECG